MASTEFIPKIAISIHAHPDDQEFTVAGTLAKWIGTGCQVISAIVTSGEAGFNDPSKIAGDKPALAKIREAEQNAANSLLGIQETRFLHYPDGELEPTMNLRRDITRLIRQYRPEVVLTGDPQGLFYGNAYVNHPDHRAAAQAAIYAVFPSAETRLIFTELLDEGLEPHKVKRLYVHGPEQADTWVDISSTIEIKIAALRKHSTQLGDWDPGKMIREWAVEEGKEHGLKYAEAYKVMIMVEEEDRG